MTGGRQKATAPREMPLDAASGDESHLHDKQQHPERKDRAVNVKNGTGQRRAHHAVIGSHRHATVWRPRDPDTRFEAARIGGPERLAEA